jgi:hypothetical protein
MARKPAKNERSVTRDLEPLMFRAAVAPASLNEDKRTVDLIWTTGAKVLRSPWFGERYYEELSLDPKHVRLGRLENGAPLLDAHNAYSTSAVIGVVEGVELKAKSGRATVRFGTDEESERIWQKVREGILRQVSVGYTVHRYEKIEDASEKIPTFRAVDWEPMELSMVPIGADAGAAVRADAPRTTHPCEFVTYEERTMAKKIDPNDITPAETEQHDTPAAADADQVKAEERARIVEVQRVGGALGLSVELVRKHVEAGTSIDAFRKIAFDEYERAKKPVVEDTARPFVVAGEDAKDKFQRAAGDWLLRRAAVADVVTAAAKARGETVQVGDGGDCRGLGLLELARRCLELAGVSTRGMDKMTLSAHALGQRGAGYAATGDFPVLLENTLHKVLLAAYGTTPDTWSRFCAVGQVSDFRAHPRYRMGTFGSLDKVNEHGEFKNKSIPDARKESITAQTRGNIIGITRQALVNDDMGAFSRLATMLGRAARLSIEVDVYDTLKLNAGLGPLMGDGVALFDATHGNVGAGAALSMAAVEADRVVMGSQTDDSGNEILDLRPEILVIPIGLGGNARTINDAQYDPDTANKLQKPNVVRGLYRDIVDTARLTGTRRYSFANPMIASVLEVAFLDGQQTPFLEMQNGWRIDGVEWKARLDYAVGGIDYRGAVTDAGA